MHGPIDPAIRERAEERARLARWRLYAGAAMAATLAATVGLYAVEPPRAWWVDLAHAAAKAGFVGAVADWFAVNALFRYPFGRWTGIGGLIPREKQRLAGGMGRFVARQFFTPESIRRGVEGVDVAAAAARWLADPVAARRAAAALAPFLPRLLDLLPRGARRPCCAGSCRASSPGRGRDGWPDGCCAPCSTAASTRRCSAMRSPR